MNNTLEPNLLSPRWRKVLTDLWNDKTRTSLVVASIAAGVFAIGMIMSSYFIMADNINRSYAAVNPPNMEIWTQSFDNDLVDAVKKVDGVEDAQGRQLIEMRARRGGENWQNLTLIGLSDFHSQVNLLAPVEGTIYPQKDEVLLSQNLIHRTGFHPGDMIEIEMPDGVKHTLKVVGLVTDQTSAKPDLTSPNNAFVSIPTLRNFGLDLQFNEMYVTVKGDGSNLKTINQISERVKQQVKDSGRTVLRMETNRSDQHPMSDIVLAVLGLLGALGGMITLLSSSLIINTLNALLTQQLRQIGIMKLVGARSYQIMGMYITLILSYSAIALAIAVPAAIFAGYGMALLMANLLGAVLQGFQIVPAAVITQIVIAIVIPLGAGFFPVNSGVHTHVQQAISNYRPGDSGSKGRFNFFNTKNLQWFPRPVLLSFRNTFRKRGRLMLTIFTLTVAGSVFIAVFNVRDSMGTLIDNLMQHFMGDVTLTMREPYRVSKVKNDLLTIPGVQKVEAWGGANAEVRDANDKLVVSMAIIAPPQDTLLLKPDFITGRWLLPGERNSIVVSDKIYKFYPGLKPGDSLLIKIPGRDVESWKVVGVFRFVDMLGDPIGYGTFEFISDRIHLADQAASFRITTNAHDAESQLTLTRLIDDTLSNMNYRVQNAQSGIVIRNNATQAIDILVIFLLLMAALTAFVGSIGLTGTMSINVLERTREIGVMRTIEIGRAHV